MLKWGMPLDTTQYHYSHGFRSKTNRGMVGGFKYLSAPAGKFPPTLFCFFYWTIMYAYQWMVSFHLMSRSSCLSQGSIEWTNGSGTRSSYYFFIAWLFSPIITNLLFCLAHFHPWLLFFYFYLFPRRILALVLSPSQPYLSNELNSGVIPTDIDWIILGTGKPSDMGHTPYGTRLWSQSLPTTTWRARPLETNGSGWI